MICVCSFTGVFKHGMKHGLGKYKFRNRDEYEGDWMDDLMHGFGIFKWMTGSRSGDCYIGDWKEGRREGKGEYTYALGDKYEGMFKNNEPHGKGKFVQFRTIQVDPSEKDNFEDSIPQTLNIK